MKLLIAGSIDKNYIHLEAFGKALKKLQIEYLLVNDAEYAPGLSTKSVNQFLHPRKKFNELIKEFKPDAVFVDRRTNFGIFTVKSKIPLFVYLRGDIWSEAKWASENSDLSILKKINDFYRRKIIWDENFQKSSLILPICVYLKNIVKERYPEKKIETMYQGIIPSRWHPQKGMSLKHPCVGLLQGAVIWGKVQEMLILDDVLEKFPHITFYWAGDGPYRDKILPILNKHSNFKWLGHLDYPNKVREYLTEIDVYALVSGIDMAPLTLQEAQLMEKPVIATNVGGIPELMQDGITGFLVEKGNSKDLSEKISLLINDEKRVKEMGRLGRKFIKEKFSWDIIAQDFVNILKKNDLLKN